MKKKYIYSLFIVGTILAINLLLAIIYGIWLSKNNNEDPNISSSGCIKIVYSDDKKISLTNLKPQSDEDGMTTSANTMTITNNCKEKQKIELDLDVLKKSKVDDSKMHIYLNGGFDLGPTLLNTLRYKNGTEKVVKTYQLMTSEIEPNDTKRINLRLWLDENVPPQDDDNDFYAEYYIESGESSIEPMFKEKLMEKYKVSNEEIDYSTIASEEIGFTDIDGNYYLRGNITDNYVSFANHTWRIVGITSDDNVKLIYADGDLSNKYNDVANLEEKVAYKDSELNKFLDNWYDESLKDFDDLIVKYKYCNDTSNTVDRRIEYGAYTRVFNTNSPSIKCLDTDKEYGGEVESKIGLLTLDEANIIGGITKANNSDYYLYDGKDYFTMSPAFMGNQAWIGTVTATGKIDAAPANTVKEVRPVIVLSNTINVTGSGTQEDPYIIDNK